MTNKSNLLVCQLQIESLFRKRKENREKKSLLSIQNKALALLQKMNWESVIILTYWIPI
jgi:hypothetical protein